MENIQNPLRDWNSLTNTNKIRIRSPLRLSTLTTLAAIRPLLLPYPRVRQIINIKNTIKILRRIRLRLLIIIRLSPAPAAAASTHSKIAPKSCTSRCTGATRIPWGDRATTVRCYQWPDPTRASARATPIADPCNVGHVWYHWVTIEVTWAVHVFRVVFPPSVIWLFLGMVYENRRRRTRAVARWRFIFWLNMLYLI
jgi:hypothetical protein